MVKILYFSTLAERLGKTGEDLRLPASVSDVRGLLKFLRMRGEEWPIYLVDDKIQVTVNKRFAELDSPLSDGAEIGLMLARH